MTLKTILRATEKFVTNNSPGILTGLGVAGTVTTALLAGKGAYSAALILVEKDRYDTLDTKKKVELVWKEFIPAAAVGTVTVAAIIASNHIGTRRAAAITAAFKLSEEISQQYKEKVLETLGLQKEEKMRAELAADKMVTNPPSAGMIIVAGSDVLCFDELSGRYFQHQIENIRKAVNEINYQVNNYYFASLTDFYEKIGLEATGFSQEVGWNTDKLLDVTFTACIYQDRPAVMLSYETAPTRSYDRCQ